MHLPAARQPSRPRVDADVVERWLGGLPAEARRDLALARAHIPALADAGEECHLRPGALAALEAVFARSPEVGRPPDPLAEADVTAEVRVLVGCAGLSGIEPRVMDDHPFDACAQLRPDGARSIVIGVQLARTLPTAELRWVIGHEAAHLTGYHAVVSVLAEAAGLAFLPRAGYARVRFTALVRYLSRRHEQAADTGALQLGASALAGARFMEWIAAREPDRFRAMERMDEMYLDHPKLPARWVAMRHAAGIDPSGDFPRPEHRRSRAGLQAVPARVR